MRKEAYFDVFKGPGWPHLKQLEKYFIAPKGQEWSYHAVAARSSGGNHFKGWLPSG